MRRFWTSIAKGSLYGTFLRMGAAVLLATLAVASCQGCPGPDGCSEAPGAEDRSEARSPVVDEDRTCRRRAVGLVHSAVGRSLTHWSPTRKGPLDLPAADRLPDRAERIRWDDRYERVGSLWIGRYGVQPDPDNFRWEQPGVWSESEVDEVADRIGGTVARMVEEKRERHKSDDDEESDDFQLFVGVPNDADLSDVGEMLRPAAEHASIYLLFTTDPSGVHARQPFPVASIENKLREIERAPSSERRDRLGDLFDEITGGCEGLESAFGFDALEAPPFYSLGNAAIDSPREQLLSTEGAKTDETPVERIVECGCSTIDLAALEAFLVHEFPPRFAALRALPFDPSPAVGREATVESWVRSQAGDSASDLDLGRRAQCIRRAHGVQVWNHYTRDFHGNDPDPDVPTVDRPISRRTAVPVDNSSRSLPFAIRVDRVRLGDETLHEGTPLAEMTDEELRAVVGDNMGSVRELVEERGDPPIDVSVGEGVKPDVLGPLLGLMSTADLRLLVADGNRTVPDPSMPAVSWLENLSSADSADPAADGEARERAVSRTAGECEDVGAWLRSEMAGSVTSKKQLLLDSLYDIVGDCPCESVDLAAVERLLLEAKQPFGPPVRAVPFYATDLESLEVESRSELADRLVAIADPETETERDKNRRGTVWMTVDSDADCHGQLAMVGGGDDKEIMSTALRSRIRTCLKPAPSPGAESPTFELSWEVGEDGTFRSVEGSGWTGVSDEQRECVLSSVDALESETDLARFRAPDDVCRYEASVRYDGEDVDVGASFESR